MTAHLSVLIPAEGASAKSAAQAFHLLGINPNSFKFFPRIKIIITNYDDSNFYRYNRPKIKSSGVKINKTKNSFSSALLQARLWWLDDVAMLVYIAVFLLRGWALIPLHKEALLKVFSHMTITTVMVSTPSGNQKVEF